MRVLVRGGGDLASGVILRMRRAGWDVLVTEVAEPRAVRRTVSFAQAIYSGGTMVEEISARRVQTLQEIEDALSDGIVPTLVDPGAEIRYRFRPQVLVDARMRKLPSELGRQASPLVIGLGPGFVAGTDCDAVVETNRGPFLGRVYWQGTAQADTGVPEKVGAFESERVLRSPQEGILEPLVEIGQVVRRADGVARVNGALISAPFDGVLRGLIQGGVLVHQSEKVGDVDPRGDPRVCWLVSDKALAVAGGVIEAILTWSAGKGIKKDGFAPGI